MHFLSICSSAVLDNHLLIFTIRGHIKTFLFLIKTIIERDNKKPTQGKLNVDRVYPLSTRKNTTIPVVRDLIRVRKQ